MKCLLIGLLCLTSSAFAVTSNTLKGNVDLDAIVNPHGRALGIQGKLPVSIAADVKLATMYFAGYQKNIVCLEYGPEEIPSHPETAPCVKEETRWVPAVSLEVYKSGYSMQVGDVIKEWPLERFAVHCISNLKDITVVGEEEPAEAPALILLAPGCAAGAYPEIHEEKLAPRALKGGTMEAHVYLNLSLGLGGELMMVHGEAFPLTVESLTATIGGMNDFGGHRTPIFEYFDRVIFE